jgi:hypothetical protein
MGLVEACDLIAPEDPEGAQAVFAATLTKVMHVGDLNLEGRTWLTAIPPGLTVQGSLNLCGSSVRTLPQGLRVRNTLDLRDTPIASLPHQMKIGDHCLLNGTRIGSLPRRLEVGTVLDLQGCAEWDGQIPPGVSASGVRTDRHPVNLSSDSWRRIYPAGEPTPVRIANDLRALMATGMPPWDAKIALLEAGVEPATFPEFAALPSSFLAPGAMREPERAFAALHGIAQIDPVGANRALNAYLEGRTLDKLDLSVRDWITALPQGLRVRERLMLGHVPNLQHLPAGFHVEGVLDLAETGLAALPDRLRVDGDLYLTDCPNLEALPAGLRVGGLLDLTGSMRWDGQVPADAQVGEGRPNLPSLFTDGHLSGITLGDWRKLHPHGERP